MKDWYRVWPVSESEDDGEDVLAATAEIAAMDWAEVTDRESADYTIVGGKVVDVFVRGPDGVAMRWTVSGRSVPEYRASLVGARLVDAKGGGR